LFFWPPDEGDYRHHFTLLKEQIADGLHRELTQRRLLEEDSTVAEELVGWIEVF
jgi:hypothetical protein